MPELDSAAKAQLAKEAVLPRYFIFLDVDGEQIRAATGGEDVTLSGTGDDELDGTYAWIDPRVVSIGEVSHKEGGSDTLEIRLSGQLLPDNELLNAIGDKSKWQGSVARLWIQIRDENRVPQGAIAPYYTGYMDSVEIEPAADFQTINLKIENYLASLSEASQRSYLGQSEYDAADKSAGATIAAANGRTGSGVPRGSRGGGGGMSDIRSNPRLWHVR